MWQGLICNARQGRTGGRVSASSGPERPPPPRRAQDTLAVCDAKLGNTIKDKLNIACVHDDSIMELMRGLRSQIEELVTAATPAEMRSMAIGLAHSLSRYKLKFSPDKVDTMIVQAIGLLDDLDKELNTCVPIKHTPQQRPHRHNQPQRSA